jgi:hypothetical protein
VGMVAAVAQTRGVVEGSRQGQARTEIVWSVPGVAAHRGCAYKLALPEGARIQDVFHVGLVKPFSGDPQVQTPPLPLIEHG